MYAQTRNTSKPKNVKVFGNNNIKGPTQVSTTICYGCHIFDDVFIVSYLVYITVSDYVLKNLTLNGMEIAALSLTLTGLLLVLWPERCPAGLYKPFKCCVKNEIEAQHREQRSHSHSVLHFNKT